MGIFAGWLLTVALIPVGIFFRGLCISATWGWFIAPVTGWREISISEAVGIAIFFSIFASAQSTSKAQYEDKSLGQITMNAIAQSVGMNILAPLTVLAIAWFWEAFFLPMSN